ncbi:MAG: ribosome small subunit-dependent GTPase A [Anaerolineaceae bacterium]|nr:ribosome small subunit-dependent GTPase A [Anaerolineaceae bacterium]
MKKHLNVNTGTVIAVYQNQVSVQFDDQVFNCQLVGGATRKKQNKGRTWTEILVGDQVEFAHGVIQRVLPRQNHFSRRKAGPKAVEQKIAANIDQIIAVLSVQNPAPKWNLLDRYLTAAEIAEIPVLICMTKMDLEPTGEGQQKDLEDALAVYQDLGYAVQFTSTQHESGLEALRKDLQGKTSLMIGKSGVGKSSLMNALFPQVARSVGVVGNESGKGKHTTSSAWMHCVDSDTRLIDTSGTREFGLWLGEAEDLQYCFIEMQSFIGKCRFGLSCWHDEEPDCAVRQAVIQGEIDPRRYQSYLKLLDEERAS